MLDNKYLILLFLCFVLWYSSKRSIKTTTIVTRNGNITGEVQTNRKGGEFFAFQSIPYAKPPIGNRRFKLAEMAEPWEGTLDGTREIPRCLQFEFNVQKGGEDCLYLNVYTPKLPGLTDEKVSMSVMVYIHGGAFYEGSASPELYGPHYLMTEDIVLVVINYRLGALGFLHLSDPSGGISANNGLKDQRLALEWVQQNIEDFGGNPKLVTIFGESAGGASVHYHMLSPLSKGLFHRVIAQSGTANCHWTNGSTDTAISLAKVLGFPTDNKKKMVKDLRKVNYQAIFEAQNIMEWAATINSKWDGGPVVEGDVEGAIIPEPPLNVLKSGNFTQVPLMLGYTNKEGILLEVLVNLYGLSVNYNPIDDVPGIFDGKYRETVAGLIRGYYYGDDLFLNNIGDSHIDLWTDVWFKYPIVEAARIQSKHTPVYLYEFGADTELNFFKKLTSKTSEYAGASHVDDTSYLFSNKHIAEGSFYDGSIEDILISRMVRLWTNFAKYGRPTVGPDALLDNKDWLPTRENYMQIMRITDDLEFERLRDQRIDFWDAIHDVIASHDSVSQ